jgi:succinate dehydrogenase/fumarate reductase flavoprotein subunit
MSASHGKPCTEDWETTNVASVARVLVQHAAQREETRGSHWREDHPSSRDEWRVRLVTTMDAAGTLRTDTRPPSWVPGMEEE